MNQARPVIRGLRHLALKVTDITRSRAFYEQLFGFRVVWEPDPGSVYLSSGSDNLALHQIPGHELHDYAKPGPQFLDHCGLIVDSPTAVDRLFSVVEPQLSRFGARIVKRPKQHRDGSVSFYLTDPDGNVIQILYEPNISSKM